MNFFSRPALVLLKVIVFAAMTWVIVNRLFIKDDFNIQWQLFTQSINRGETYLLFIVITLMPVNWLLETLKWKLLLRETPTSFFNLLKGVIAGVTFGFVTPGRGGEFIGRVLYLDEEKKAKIFYLSSIGGFAQTVVTIVAGSVFVSFLPVNSFVAGLLIGVAAAVTFLYFRFDWLNGFISAIPFLATRGLTIPNNELPGITTQVTVLMLSFLRYAVYVLQYILVFWFLGLNLPALALLIHTVLFLLLQTFSPLLPFFDISYRGATALWVFTNVTDNQLAVIAGVTTIWLLNLVVPSVVGYLFILRKR